MALVNATLNLKLNRKTGTFSVLSTSTRIYSQDENVTLTVDGWTLEEVTKTSGKTPYEPYFRIVNADGVVLAECALSPDDSPTPTTEDTYVMSGTLSTNTDKMVMAFASGGYQPGWQYDFNGLVYSTESANPIATGSVQIWAFDSQSGTAPSNLPTASEVLDALTEKIDSHIDDTNNPHEVTAEQVGAYTKTHCDGTYATLTTAANLQSLIDAANASISALQTAVQTANLAIQSNALALTTKANTATTYRKDETYSRTEVIAEIAARNATHLLEGKSFVVPTTDRARTNLIAYLVKSLGGNISSSGIEPGTPVSEIAMTADDGTNHNLKVVKVGDEYTTEVS